MTIYPFYFLQGILGLAFRELSKPNQTIEPWFDSLVALQQKLNLLPETSKVFNGVTRSQITQTSIHESVNVDSQSATARNYVPDYTFEGGVNRSLHLVDTDEVEYIHQIQSSSSLKNLSLSSKLLLPSSHEESSSHKGSTFKYASGVIGKDDGPAAEDVFLRNCFGLELCGSERKNRELIQHHGKLMIGNLFSFDKPFCPE